MFNSYEMEMEIDRHRDVADEKGRTIHLRLPDKPSLLRRFLYRLGRKQQAAPTEEVRREPVLRAGH